MGASAAKKVIAALERSSEWEGNQALDELSEALGHGASEEAFELFKEAVSHPRALVALGGPDGSRIDSMGWPNCLDGIFETYSGDWSEVQAFAENLGGPIGDGIVYAMVRHGKLGLEALSPLLRSSLAKTYAEAPASDRVKLISGDSPLLRDQRFANTLFRAIRDSNSCVESRGLERLYALAEADLQVWGLASMSFEGLRLLEYAKPPPKAFETLLDVLLGHHNVGTWDHRLNANSPGDTCTIVLVAYVRCFDGNTTIPDRFAPLVLRATKSSKARSHALLLEVWNHLPSDAQNELDRPGS